MNKTTKQAIVSGMLTLLLFTAAAEGQEPSSTTPPVLSPGTVIGIDFGPVPSANWNNLSASGALNPGSVVDLEGQVLEGMGMSLRADRFTTDGKKGWKPVGDRPLTGVSETATEDLAVGKPEIQVTLTGLNPSSAFNLAAVTAAEIALNRTDTVTVAGAEKALVSSIPRKQSAGGGYHHFLNVRPTREGTITITVADASGQRNPILNLIRMEAVARAEGDPSLEQPGISEEMAAEQKQAQKAEKQEKLRTLTSDGNLFDVQPRTYTGKNLTGVDVPVGPVGGGVIRLNGHAERDWWHIFHNHESRAGSGKVPNSFFAIRTQQAGKTEVRALQTREQGPFAPMQEVSLQTRFPLATYTFKDDALPVTVELEAYSFLIPMNLKDSAIPSAVFRYTVSNPGKDSVEVSLLAAQQNAIGFDGYGVVGGENLREFAGYGSNRNRIVAGQDRTSLAMTGDAGSMVLSAYETAMSHAAGWESLDALYKEFSAKGKLAGAAEASSPGQGITVDGALAKSFTLNPGEQKSVTFVLSWHIPKGTFGRADIAAWYFPNVGSQYENWWPDAMEVDNYVAGNFDQLDGLTRAYLDTLYASNLPEYVLDRVASNISVLKSPTSFWTKDGYFGIWESTSNKQDWYGNVKHVLHYAQGHARLFPDLDRVLRHQDLQSMLDDGLLPSREGEPKNAMDGHFGAILGVYRAHLLSTDKEFLQKSWPAVKKAMDYAIETYDPDRDGMLTGRYHNTLDCDSSGTSPWMGSLYLAALKAAAEMARLADDEETSKAYGALFETGRKTQDAEMWSESLGYYIEKPENLPGTRIMGDAVSIDMLLGQWWANQLNLGQIYPMDRTLLALQGIYETNIFTDPGRPEYPKRYRDFLGTGDSGWQMVVWPGPVPSNTIHYYSEVMSGFEYSLAATLLQYGKVREGLSVVRTIYDRYDGRLRDSSEVTTRHNSTVFGTGSPVGEDECGDFYARALSSWSTLLALQGFRYDGPKGILGFKPVWKPEDHRSFFTTAEGWGLFSQQREGGIQKQQIELKYGTLAVRELIFACNDAAIPKTATVRVGSDELKSTLSIDGSDLRIVLAEEVVLKAGDSLLVEFECRIEDSSSDNAGHDLMEANRMNVRIVRPQRRNTTSSDIASLRHSGRRDPAI
jgi:non-lysosomal glucosylceramidase